MKLNSFLELCLKKDIVSYEQELLNRLRNEYYFGIPLSIYILSSSLCSSQCHYLSIHLTRGMDKFRIVRANINELKNESLGNHTWIEKDGYVYDVTDGFKWKKEVYYEIYQPEIISSYDEETCKNYDVYQLIMEEIELQKQLSFDSELMLEIIELKESEKKSINHKKLVEEIEIFRKKENLEKTYSLKYVKQKAKNFFDE